MATPPPPPLRVLFRVERSGSHKGLVTAVFPSEAFDYAGREPVCYDSASGHGGCSLAWYRGTRPATPAEYADLLREIRAVYESDAFDVPPARLVIARRMTAGDRAERERQARESRAAVRRDPSLAPWSPDARAAAFAD